MTTENDGRSPAGPGSSPSVEPQERLDAAHSIPIAGGWSLVRDDEHGPHHRDWFLCSPEGIWVAKFWDGPEAGERDARDFAAAVAQGMAARSGETEGLDPKGNSPVANGDAPDDAPAQGIVETPLGTPTNAPEGTPS